MNTEKTKVIAIGLDGFEINIARAMMREGRLPMFKDLEQRAAIFALDHGPARETGLAWEHFSTGQTPDAGERWSAVNFDSDTYEATKPPTRSRSFLTDVSCPVVAFDVPYLDLATSNSATGMANWGAHDPGVARYSKPASIVAEIEENFGPYPASKYIYGFVWPSVDKTVEMAEQLTEAVRRRTEITYWLLQERLPGWTLAVTVVAELHSATEALWHGWDANHPLHGHPSAGPARRGIEAVYEETDKMIQCLSDANPDAVLLVFSMHGMGPNKADLLSMALLPELLYRRSFGKPYLHPRPDWKLPLPALQSGENWSSAVNRQLGERDMNALSAKISGEIGRKFKRISRGIFRAKSGSANGLKPNELEWMPAAHYREYWPKMEAFALPAFYDGQIRVNLEGRESNGLVPESRYHALLDELDTMLGEVTDPVTGEHLVTDLERPMVSDPFKHSESRCDLKIQWKANAYAMVVPSIGVVGPVPQRRTGGHTGGFGYAAILGAGIDAGDNGVASSFDVVPTILKLLDLPRSNRLSGQSLI